MKRQKTDQEAAYDTVKMLVSFMRQSGVYQTELAINYLLDNLIADKNLQIKNLQENLERTKSDLARSENQIEHLRKKHLQSPLQ